MTTNDIRIKFTTQAGQWLAEWYPQETERLIAANPDAILAANPKQLRMLRTAVDTLARDAFTTATDLIDRDPVWYPGDAKAERDHEGQPVTPLHAIKFACGKLIPAIMGSGITGLLGESARNRHTSRARIGFDGTGHYWQGAIALPDFLKDLLEKYGSAISAAQEKEQTEAAAATAQRQTEALEKYRAA